MRKLRRSESRTRRRGAALVEYVLLLSLFTLAAVPAISNLQSGEKSALQSTSAKIGGSPVPTDVAPTLRETTTTTTLPPPPTTRFNSAPNVHLPDGIVVDRDTYRSFSPDVLTDPEGDPIVTKAWYGFVGSATWQNQTSDQGTNNAVLKWTTSGWKTICFRATDSLGAVGSDCCDVCVNTGTVSAVVSATANYQNATNSMWRLNGTFRTTNAGGNVTGPITINIRFDFSDGTSTNSSCATTRTGSSCTRSTAYKSTSITWIRATVTGVDGSALPCFGTWDTVPAEVTINLTSGTGAPPTITTTTTAPTTTTTTLPTTTTTPTTTLPTTTTSTTTTRATTTTRPTTTTFQS